MNLLEVRSEFPLLARRVNDRPIVYMDNASTSLKPRRVLDAERRFYEEVGANIHRGKHFLSEEASYLFARARGTIADFIGAVPEEVIFVAGATMGINLVALGLDLKPDDNVVTSVQEHHANLLPFYGRSEVRLAAVNADGLIDLASVAALIDKRTRLVTLGHVSNATGAIQDVRAFIELAHAHGVPVLLDACQSAPHLAIDVAALDADFIAFSGHKMLGPMGIGVLWGKRERLEALQPAFRGGGAVSLVTPTAFTLKPVPERFEPGTPNVAGALALAEAVNFMEDLGRSEIAAHEARLITTMLARAQRLPSSVRLLGPVEAQRRIPLLSLVVRHDHVTADHLALRLSEAHQVLVRSGHHCCHPYFDSMGAPGSVRISAHFYNTVEEVNAALDAFEETLRGLIG